MATGNMVLVIQRSLEHRSNAVQSLTITARYDETEATILLRPVALPNDDKSIRAEIERLGEALIGAAKSSKRIM